MNPRCPRLSNPAINRIGCIAHHDAIQELYQKQQQRHPTGIGMVGVEMFLAQQLLIVPDGLEAKDRGYERNRQQEKVQSLATFLHLARQVRL